MTRSVQQTRGVTVEATDGPIGDIHDIYFDDQEWTVRYYVVDTGKWLPGRKVLIPPHAVQQMTPGNVGLPVNLTREQVRNSPDMDMDRPISRRAEFALYSYYGWAPYWLPLTPAGLGSAALGTAAERERDATTGRYGGDPNLRSATEVIGYRVSATDGEIGHIDDFLINDESARIKYAVVDTRNWWPGGNVLLSPRWITDVKWSESKVVVSVTREAVKNSPEYDPATQLDATYESRLFQHYGYPIELL